MMQGAIRLVKPADRTRKTSHDGSTSLNFSQTPWVSDGPVVRSQSVTNDGCPISARFWQMWDATALSL